MTKFICETKNLSKKYKDFYALKNVNCKYVIIRICPQLYFSDTLFS